MTTEKERDQAERYRSRVRGCLLGGAIGDALGAPVEFMTLAGIRAEHGAAGVREYVADHSDGTPRHGLVTDDTQMTLFTVEGLIRAGVRADRGTGFTPAPVHHAYLRWLDTQLHDAPTGRRDGLLQGQRWLYARRAPGTTCLSALEAVHERAGAGRIPFGTPAANNSKGCGGVMRSAPFGLLATPAWSQEPPVFDWAAEAAGYTHGHPTGRLASGALALLVRRLVAGDGLDEALEATLAELVTRPGHEETSAALRAARAAARDLPVCAETVERLGGGWIAEEALAIAVYAALVHPGPEEFTDALALAVTHSGDSDSTGAICGNILGALHGETALPPELAFEVEGRGTILELADDFVWEFTAGRRLHGDHGPHTRWSSRYPGS
ncbi:ADP-ribosylglycohydrolase [Marinactinospora thermotolerans DSM 45154]|uniref:ADP-ribosylglycohydrolase n=1 Tax=Marinactinospora thermotolerans DSM 45154 TaxID=1122192 RepID=A0A1T4M2X1_9ACTN|nr:ADP-ribosylglycohydrolase family protein [Marinactinospora thermotolerans]SJZ61235.1 ADP-ribosylglycohydrolase [Marinactinospora thermotolerans DSM 45154]